MRTSSPLKNVPGSPTIFERMVALAVKLSEYDVQFELRMTIKAQALADFLLESTSPGDEPDTHSPLTQQEPTSTLVLQAPAPQTRHTLEYNSLGFTSWWLLKVDGSSGEAGSGARIVLRSLNGSTHEHSIPFSFSTTNNEAEYEASLAGLQTAEALKAEHLYILADSQVVVHQMNKQYTAKDPRMVLYLKVAKELLASFVDF